ncbi:MAG: signal peptide peptidase SppA [Planctomycetia bacterium]|nr:signal peptide peptidase SppA [Planctomycetia bacterium]
MADDPNSHAASTNPASATASGGAVQPPAPGLLARAARWLVTTVFVLSLLLNVGMFTLYSSFLTPEHGPAEVHHSGNRHADDKLAIIHVNGVIMPPFSSRVIKAIKKAKDDKHVKGVLLSIDSPGGTVTDSHQIYHELKKLAGKKPIVVSMGSIAASGGYFVAMGAGPETRIFAEPTTWTGSIGVIIPHYEVSDAANRLGIKAAPLKTGEFKDSLSPFRELTTRDKELWDNILNQSFELFLEVIDENRNTLDMPKVRALATGQIYTSRDAKQNGMIDEIGFEEDALEALKKVAATTDVNVISYQFPADNLWDALLGSARANDPAAQWRAILELAAPRAMYYFSAGLPAARE